MGQIESIELKDVSFSYDPAEKGRILLKKINIKFIKGKIYSLVGNNGTGKSTIVSILLGLYNDLCQGEVLYNGINIKLLDMYMIRKKLVAVTEQEPVLLNGSVVENIFMNEVYDKEQLNFYDKICRLFNVEEIVAGDKEKNAESIQNTNFSGGEKQKISIIRTILKDAEVLIFDEPTSALDQISIENFIQIIRSVKNNKIIIIITHDHRLIEISDISYDFN